LQVCILAWDFSPLLARKREFLQSLIINWQTEKNLTFLFDNAYPIGGSHHHKFVVVDGWIAFAGGLDFATGRWDVPAHTPANRHRISSAGKPFNPHHDIQGGIIGPAAVRLSEVFAQRWERAGGEPLQLPEPVPTEAAIQFSVNIRASQVAISRTQPRLLSPPIEPVQEIRQLYLDAIAAAEKLIYLENQYFSSEAVYQALRKCLRDKDRPPVQIVLVLPKHNLGWLEEVSMGVIQAKMLKSLQEEAAGTKHSLGCTIRTGPRAGR